MVEINKLPLFVRCVIQNFPFIEEDFDALTNYQLISKVVGYLNKIIISQNQVIDTTNELSVAFQQLHDYVANYFDNLDLQEEVNNKLDEMAESGVLQEIITTYIQANVAWTFDTVADMKSSTNLINGSYAQTLGFYTANDGGGAVYKITNNGTANEKDIIAIGDLKAHLQYFDSINVKQVGAYGDDSHDDVITIQHAIDLAHETGINKVLLPIGTYRVSKALIIPEYMVLEGVSRIDTIILKTANESSNPFSVDAVVIFKQTDNFEFAYNHSQTIKNLTIKGNNDTVYGVYAEKAVPRTTISNVVVRNIQYGIYYKKGGWLYTVEDVSILPEHTGFYAGDVSTTLNLNNVYVNGGDTNGYYLTGVTYSSFNNVACDNCTGVAYLLKYCNLEINGIGCECKDGTGFINLTNSTSSFKNGTVIVNKDNASYITIDLNGSIATFDNINFRGNASTDTAALGQFLKARQDGDVEFNNCKCGIKFAVANGYTSNYSTQKLKSLSTDVMLSGFSETVGLGNITRNANDTFADNTNLLNSMGAILFNNKNGIRYSLNNKDRRYLPSHNLGDIYVNQTPTLSGIAMFQQISDSQRRNFVGTITDTNISGSSGTITLTSLALDVADWGVSIETGRKIDSSSGGVATISAIDTDTNTLTLSSITGTFAVNDTLVYRGRGDIDSTKISNIQSIGYGTTAQRPQSPVNGYMYWDTTLGKPIWRAGSNWKDATGANV